MKVSKQTLKLSVSVVAAALIGMFSIAPASASTQKGESADASNQVCVAQIETGSQTCYTEGTDWASATEKLTGTPVIVAATAAEYKASYDALASRSRTVSPMAVTIILGYIYDDINYGGGSTHITGQAGSGSSCGGQNWYYNNLGTIGWNDRASAMQPRSGCNMNIWENANQGGAHVGGYSNNPWLGVLSDKGTSLSWTP